MVDDHSRRNPRAHAAYLTRLLLRGRDGFLPVRTADILHLEAQDDYVAVYVAGGRHLLRMPMSRLSRRLDPEQFVRIHRSHIVNVDQVLALVPFAGVRLEAELRDGTRIVASRTRSRELRRRAL